MKAEEKLNSASNRLSCDKAGVGMSFTGVVNVGELIEICTGTWDHPQYPTRIVVVKLKRLKPGELAKGCGRRSQS